MEQATQEYLNKFLGAQLGAQRKEYIKKIDYVNVIGIFDITNIETETKQNKKGFNYIQTTIQIKDKKTNNAFWLDLRNPQAHYLQQYLLANPNPELYIKAIKNEDKTFSAFISFDKLQWI